MPFVILYYPYGVKARDVINYDDTIPFQYLKTVVITQDSTLPETESQFIFSR